MPEVNKKETAEEVTAPAAEEICETNPEVIIAEIRDKYKGGAVPIGSRDAKRICKLRRLIDKSINHMTDTALPAQKKSCISRQKTADERHKMIRTLRESGMKYSDIADQVGLKEDSVRNYCNKYKIRPPWGPGRKRKIDPETAEKLHKAGKTWKEIGEAFGIREETAMAAAKRYREKEEDKEWHGTRSG